MGARGRGSKKPKKPLLKEVMRKFYIRIHPDLFQRYPIVAKTNEESFSSLMEFFNTLKEGALPEKQTLDLPFFMRTKIEGKFDEVYLTISTSGGVCHNKVKKDLSAFFKGMNGFIALFDHSNFYHIKSSLKTCSWHKSIVFIGLIQILTFLLYIFIDIGLNSEFEWGTDYWAAATATELVDRDYDEEQKQYYDEMKEKSYKEEDDIINMARKAHAEKDKFNRDKISNKHQNEVSSAQYDHEISGEYNGNRAEFNFDGIWGKSFFGSEYSNPNSDTMDNVRHNNDSNMIKIL